MFCTLENTAVTPDLHKEFFESVVGGMASVERVDFVTDDWCAERATRVPTSREFGCVRIRRGSQQEFLPPPDRCGWLPGPNILVRRHVRSRREQA